MVDSFGHALSKKIYCYNTGSIILRLGMISRGKSSAGAGHLTASRLSAPPSLSSRFALALALVCSRSRSRSLSLSLSFALALALVRSRSRSRSLSLSPTSALARHITARTTRRSLADRTITTAAAIEHRRCHARLDKDASGRRLCFTLTLRLGPRTTHDGQLRHARRPRERTRATRPRRPLFHSPSTARSARPSADSPLRTTRPVDYQHPCRHPARSRRTTRPLVDATSRRDASSADKTDLGMHRATRGWTPQAASNDLEHVGEGVRRGSG
jgi:hypothetical protein